MRWNFRCHFYLTHFGFIIIKCLFNLHHGWRGVIVFILRWFISVLYWCWLLLDVYWWSIVNCKVRPRFLELDLLSLNSVPLLISQFEIDRHFLRCVSCATIVVLHPHSHAVL